MQLEIDAISLTGAQAGLITDDVHRNAKVMKLDPSKIDGLLAANKVVIVAGFRVYQKQEKLLHLAEEGLIQLL